MASISKIAVEGTTYDVHDSRIANVLQVANGGTGVTTAQAERNRLGLGNTTGEVPIANGGTGAATAADARKSLGLATVNDTDWAYLYHPSEQEYLKWRCKQNVVYIQWHVRQESAGVWIAGYIPKVYRPAETAVFSAWLTGNNTASAWVDYDTGAVKVQNDVAVTGGLNAGSGSYVIG